MAITIGHTKGHYDEREVEFGRVYRWCPESVVVGCECGEKAILTASVSTCGECGADHTDLVSGELTAKLSGGKTLRPWRYARDDEGAGIPF